MDNNAFAGEFGTTRFNTLKIPEGYRVIGAMAFAYNGCGGDLVLPDSLEAIGMAAFFRNAFTSLTVPAKVKELPLSMARGNKGWSALAWFYADRSGNNFIEQVAAENQA